MTRPPVLTKKDFVERYARGEFGNASPTWQSLDKMEECSVLESGSPFQLYHVRNRIKGVETWYNLEADEVADCWFKAIQVYGDVSLYISAMAPTEKTLFQGEVMRGSRWGLELTYTTVAKPMRDALKECTQHANGVRAMLLLQQFLCDKSLTWLATLLDEYVDHVVEFSTYSVEWGTLSGYNTVFWEVRLY